MAKQEIRQQVTDLTRQAAETVNTQQRSLERRRGWLGVAQRVNVQMKQNHTSLLAAGVAFKALLSLFPAIVALISIWGLAANPEQVAAQVAGFTSALPAGAASLLEEQMTQIAAGRSSAVSLALIVSVVLALWTASGGMTGLIEGCNAAYGRVDSRAFPIKRGLALLMTVGAVLFLLVSLGAIVVLPAAMDNIGLRGEAKALIRIVKWPMLALIVMGALAVIYRYAPDAEKPPMRWITPGGVVAMLLWLGGSALFTVYVESFGRFGETYGSLAGVIVLMLWLYLTTHAVLLGAEINAQLDREDQR